MQENKHAAFELKGHSSVGRLADTMPPLAQVLASRPKLLAYHSRQPTPDLFSSLTGKSLTNERTLQVAAPLRGLENSESDFNLDQPKKYQLDSIKKIFRV